MVHKDAMIYGHHGIDNIMEGMKTFHLQHQNVSWIFHKFHLIGKVFNNDIKQLVVRVSFTFDRYRHKNGERLKCTATEYIDFTSDGLMMSIGYIEGPSEPIPIATIIEPNSNDVICGIGSSINTHPGNQQYCQFVIESKSFYQAATKLEKRTILRGIVDKIHNLNPPGRFLIKYERGYIEIPFEKAVDKIRSKLGEGGKPHTQEYAMTDSSAEVVLTAVDNEKMPLPKQQEPRGGFFRSAKAKTELCRHYATPKGCAFGDKCNYAHGEHELVKE